MPQPPSPRPPDPAGPRDSRERPTPPPPQPLLRWIETMESRLLERPIAVRLVLLAVLSRTHVLLLGPPGTGKSLLARLGCESVGGRLFSTLLTKFSQPEDVFGPLSLPRLEAGAYERLTERYLPTADVAFLDEIYKANSSILNSLLTILNERMYFNGAQPVSVPLRTVVAASNEVPDHDEGLDALDDRLLLRVVVDSIQGDDAFLKLIRGDADLRHGVPPTITRRSLEALDGAASSIGISDLAVEGLRLARFNARQERLAVSDRRWRQIVDILRTMAVAEGVATVAPGHLGVLRYALWRRPDDQPKVRSVLAKMIDGMHVAPTAATASELAKILVELKAELDAKSSNYGYGYYDRDGAEKRRREALHKAANSLASASALRAAQLDLLRTPLGMWSAFWGDLFDSDPLSAAFDDIRTHASLVAPDGQSAPSLPAGWPMAPLPSLRSAVAK